MSIKNTHTTEFTGDATKLNRTIDSVQQRMHKLRAVYMDYEIAAQAVNRAGDNFIKVGAGIIATLTAIGAIATKQWADFEKLGIAIENFTGDAATATQMVKDLQEFAATTPLEFKGIEAGATQLLAFGEAAEDVIPILETLGQAAAVLPGLDLSQIIRAREYARSGVLLGRMLAPIGITPAEIRRTASEMGISLAEAFDEAVNTRFAGLFDKLQGTLAVSLQNLQDYFQQAMGAIGAGMEAPIIRRVQVLQQAFKNIQAWAEENQDVIERATEAGLQVLEKAILPITAALEGLASRIAEEPELVEEWITSLTKLGVALVWIGGSLKLISGLLSSFGLGAVIAQGFSIGKSVQATRTTVEAETIARQSREAIRLQERLATLEGQEAAIAVRLRAAREAERAASSRSFSTLFPGQGGTSGLSAHDRVVDLRSQFAAIRPQTNAARQAYAGLATSIKEATAATEAFSASTKGLGVSAGDISLALMVVIEAIKNWDMTVDILKKDFAILKNIWDLLSIGVVGFRIVFGELLEGWDEVWKQIFYGGSLIASGIDIAIASLHDLVYGGNETEAAFARLWKTMDEGGNILTSLFTTTERFNDGIAGIGDAADSARGGINRLSEDLQALVDRFNELTIASQIAMRSMLISSGLAEPSGTSMFNRWGAFMGRDMGFGISGIDLGPRGRSLLREGYSIEDIANMLFSEFESQDAERLREALGLGGGGGGGGGGGQTTTNEFIKTKEDVIAAMQAVDKALSSEVRLRVMIADHLREESDERQALLDIIRDERRLKEQEAMQDVWMERWNPKWTREDKLEAILGKPSREKVSAHDDYLSSLPKTIRDFKEALMEATEALGNAIATWGWKGTKPDLMGLGQQAFQPLASNWGSDIASALGIGASFLGPAGSLFGGMISGGLGMAINAIFGGNDKMEIEGPVDVNVLSISPQAQNQMNLRYINPYQSRYAGVTYGGLYG